ncbi:asparagine synthase (glutamine-hydrolyzing) [Rubinisphaera italica]|uniref:asparagine synthase (glutamine-hydrolyzing) n=1 Tax=Rubinisphaera italica TaxID=2527969 RepID=A0A5C5XG81_9PLAN|nr:asparagine synthase (glutamine-hydrolyzing) [Rubinisphaera italica]TWT61185.1 Asparagine synthetase [glutamine-hydrolyzing] 1 [Rubinisphaera italica]
MCGIVGAISLDGRPEFPASTLEKMCQAIQHRGPDDEHKYFEPGLAIGARRLSIIDVAHGRQPISNEDGQIQVAFNGELFDFPILREQLIQKGHTFKTHCDTEAWAHLYEEHEDDVFLQARGQFAACVWDKKKRKLLLGRDRAGIAPLYYTVVGNWLLWSSEIRGLLASGLVKAQPDRLGLDYFFNFFCMPTRRTCFEGIHMLPPGHQLTVENGKMNVRCYWDLDFPDAGDERQFKNPAQAEEEFAEILEASVRRRLFSEVPVCCYISGGLDSMTILGTVSRVREKPIQAFTLSLEDSGPVDEREQAEESAKVLNCPIDVLSIKPTEIAKAFPEQIVATEGPIFDTSTACLMMLAKRVHERGFKVALTGEGADELLAGYIWFRMAQKFHFPGHPLPRLFQKVLPLIVGGGRKHQAPMAAFHGTRIAQQTSYELLGQSREVLYSDQMWKAVGDYSPYEDVPGNCDDRIRKWSSLNQSLYAGFKIMLPGLLLAGKGDRITMNSSVEGRYPFLDEALVEFCSQIPVDMKLRKGQNKWLLRQVAARTLPTQISGRPKTMFRAHLMANFLAPDSPRWVSQLLSEEALKKSGYFNPRGVQRAIEVQKRGGKRSMRRYVLDMGLMATLSTQLWHHLYIDPTLCDLPDWTGV